MKILNFEAGVCGRVTGNYESHWSGLIVVGGPGHMAGVCAWVAVSCWEPVPSVGYLRFDFYALSSVAHTMVDQPTENNPDQLLY